MKIAIMMRAMDQDSGFRSFTENLVDTMLKIDTDDSFLLFYRTKKHLGRFASCANVKEIFLRPHNKLLWDQVSVPYAAWKGGADILYNPKFSVPLVSHCPVAMGLQEPAWWTEPGYYDRIDVLYNRLMLPLYCRKSSQIFPMSQYILEENRKELGLSFDNAIVTLTAPGPMFRPIVEDDYLEEIRKKHGIPGRFVFTPTRVDHPGVDKSTSFYRGKNPETTLRAFLACKSRIPHDLVFAGRRVQEYFLFLGFHEADFERVHFVGFVPLQELAALYNLAELTVIPSHYEGCPATIMEAMACGCPVLVSSMGGSPEVSGDAAILMDPFDTVEAAGKMEAVLMDEGLRKAMREKGLERTSCFNWVRIAKLTLNGLVRAASRSRTGLGVNHEDHTEGVVRLHPGPPTLH